MLTVVAGRTIPLLPGEDLAVAHDHLPPLVACDYCNVRTEPNSENVEKKKGKKEKYDRKARKEKN